MDPGANAEEMSLESMAPLPLAPVTRCARVPWSAGVCGAALRGGLSTHGHPPSQGRLCVHPVPKYPVRRLVPEAVVRATSFVRGHSLDYYTHAGTDNVNKCAE
jgi:hypothetical protein